MPKLCICWATFNLSALLTGLSHSPRPDKAEISYSIKEESYKPYVDHIKKFLKAYDPENQIDTTKFDDCGGTTNSKLIFKLYTSK